MIDFVKNTIVPLQQEKLTNIIPGAKAYPAQVKVRSYEEDEVEE